MRIAVLTPPMESGAKTVSNGDEQVDSKRRTLLGSGVAAAALGLPGCCGLRGFPASKIVENRGESAQVGISLFDDSTVNKQYSRGMLCVDVHAHFFNASDVPVGGFLAGPIAHAMEEPAASLIRALAPLADALAEAAPTAKREYNELGRFAQGVARLSANAKAQRLQSFVRDDRERVSKDFFRIVSSPEGAAFRAQYRALRAVASPEKESGATERVEDLDEGSLTRAMNRLERKRGVRGTSRVPPKDGFHGDGVLAFVGYMLSMRMANLASYRNVFSEGNDALGVDRVLGSLVNFDRWLDCPIRSSHEDQMHLHARISELSGKYLRPIMSYNPWTDLAEQGRALELLRDAMTRGFVGAKIYPPNGYRPWANVVQAFQSPSPSELNAALAAFWNRCIENDIPVLAHTSHSMGKDDAHNEYGGPLGWNDLFTYFADAKPPIVSLGHFGGAPTPGSKNWNAMFAKLLGESTARTAFGDMGFWSEITECVNRSNRECKQTLDTFESLLNTPIHGGLVADRLMFATDWLMLSRLEDWSAYGVTFLEIVKKLLPGHTSAIFGGNALKCFGSRIQ